MCQLPTITTTLQQLNFLLFLFAFALALLAIIVVFLYNVGRDPIISIPMPINRDEPNTNIMVPLLFVLFLRGICC